MENLARDEAFADAFRVNKTITTVWLESNNFGDDGLKALASAMEVNEVITRIGLDMSEYHLSDKGSQAVKDILRFCYRNIRNQAVKQLQAQGVRADFVELHRGGA